MNSEEMSPAVPDHVPEELVYPFSLLEPIMFEEPHERMKQLAKEAPKIFFTLGDMPFNPPHWVLTNYKDIRYVCQNPDLFSSRHVYGQAVPEVNGSRDYPLIPLELDPPAHSRPRALLNPMLSPKAMTALESDVRELVLDLIRQIEEKGSNECEFVSEFAVPLPSTLFCRLAGLPVDRAAELVHLNETLLKGQTEAIRFEACETIGDILRNVIAELKENPKDNILSKIVHSEINGESFTDEEIMGFAMLLFQGGLDTVMSALGNIFSYLGSHADKRDELIKNPDLVPSAIEELLRTFAVIQTRRHATQDTEIDGVLIKKGDALGIMFPAANFNEEVFENAEEINFNRERPGVHFSFGAGPHRCVGSHLARRELRIAVAEFLKAFPNFHVKPGAKIPATVGTFGKQSVPLLLS